MEDQIPTESPIPGSGLDVEAFQRSYNSERKKTAKTVAIIGLVIGLPIAGLVVREVADSDGSADVEIPVYSDTDQSAELPVLPQTTLPLVLKSTIETVPRTTQIPTTSTTSTTTTVPPTTTTTTTTAPTLPPTTIAVVETLPPETAAPETLPPETIPLVEPTQPAETTPPEPEPVEAGVSNRQRCGEPGVIETTITPGNFYYTFFQQTVGLSFEQTERLLWGTNFAEKWGIDLNHVEAGRTVCLLADKNLLLSVYKSVADLQ